MDELNKETQAIERMWMEYHSLHDALIRAGERLEACPCRRHKDVWKEALEDLNAFYKRESTTA